LAFGYDGSVRIKADLNHSPFDRGLTQMTSLVNKFGNTLKKLGGMVAMAFGTAAIINFAKESIKLASDIEEVQNVIDVTFGQGAAQIQEFAQSAAEAFGLSELAAKQYTGTLGAMLKSSGFTTQAAQEMSMALTGLAGDIASFYNLDTDVAFEKIRAGISGEIEPLRQLGINLSVANLETYALSKGMTKAYSAMSQTEQYLLRYNYLLDVTADAQGDFARTSGSFANQIRILQLNFDQLRIAVGNALIPVAQAVLPSINAIIAALTKLASVFAQVTALLFGRSPEVKTTSEIATSAGAAADATDKLAGSTAGAGSAAKQAAKDMKGVLAGFDELNILADNASNSLSGAANEMGIGGEGLTLPEIEGGGELFPDAEISPKLLSSIEALKKELEWLESTARKIWQVFAASWEENGGKVISAVKNMFLSVWGLIKSITDAFVSVWSNGTGLEILNTIYSIISNVLNVVSELSNRFREAWEANENGEAIWQSLLDIAQVYLGYIERISEATLMWAQELDLEPLVSAFRGLLEAIVPLVEVMTDGLAYAYENILLPLGEWFLEELAPVGIELVTAAVKALTEILTALEPMAKWLWENFLQPLAEWTGEIVISALEKVTDLLSKFSVWVSENQELVQDITIVVGSFAAAWVLVNSAVTAWNTISAIAKTATTAFGVAINLLTSPIGLVTLAIGAVIAIVLLLIKHWDDVKEAAGAAWDWIVEKWEAAGKWFEENVTEPLGKAFEAVGDSVKEIFNGIIGTVEGMVNGVIKAINWLISQLNKIKFDFPDWVPIIGGKSFGLNIPKVSEVTLPRLANGAVIPPNQQFAAILGDQRSGKNLEAPAALIKQMVIEGIQAAGGAGGSGQPIQVNVMLDRKVLARAIVPEINDMTRQAGKPVLLI